jgi:hypothetical protein
LFGLLFFLRKWPCCANGEHPNAIHFNLLVGIGNMAEEEIYVRSKPFVLETLKHICNRYSEMMTWNFL